MGLTWIRNGMELCAANPNDMDYSNPGYTQIMFNEESMDPVQVWCWEHLPTARRMSFDTFKFERDEDITAFLLRWS
jgi:hypothetical protein